MKILNAEQTREADAATIKNEPITSIDLMERAAIACTNHIHNLLSDKIKNVHIVCGKGNNGGDGLAIARLLEKEKTAPTNIRVFPLRIFVYVIEHRKEGSADFEINYERIKAPTEIEIFHVTDETLEKFHNQIHSNKKESIIVDAIFGSGLNKPVDGICAGVIKSINSSSVPVVAIDLPSGLSADGLLKDKKPVIIQAVLTLTFQFPKLAFMFAENADYCSEFIVLDIGLDKNFILKAETDHFYLLKEEVSPFLVPRKKFSHKGSNGHALLLAGSFGKMGAAVLAAKACLKSGAGLLTTHIPLCGLEIMQSAFPEAMVSADDNEKYITALPHTNNFSAVGAGPGIGTDEQTANTLKLLIQNFGGAMVLDADALNILSENKTWLAFLKPKTIITPHPKEFDRLAGAHTSDTDRLQSAKEMAFRYQLIIVLKGAHTAIVTPTKKVFFNSTGNPGMAKGGSGDVLTGIILGLIARGYEPLSAAMIGVYLHGLAGDIANRTIHEESILATDIIDNISGAFKEITN